MSDSLERSVIPIATFILGAITAICCYQWPRPSKPESPTAPWRERCVACGCYPGDRLYADSHGVAYRAETHELEIRCARCGHRWRVPAKNSHGAAS